MNQSPLHEVLQPAIDAHPHIPAEQLVEALTYPAMRQLVSIRSEDTGGDSGLKPYWLPTDTQVDVISDTISANANFYVARRRLLDRVASGGNLVDKLKTHQHDMFSTAIRLVGEAKEPSDSHTCIVAATGSGKSYMMGTFVDALHAKSEINQDDSEPNTLILTPTNNLVYQIRTDLEQQSPHSKIGVYNMNEKDLEQPVTIMTYASFIQQMKDGTLEDRSIQQVLLDEADMALGPDTRAQLEDFLSNKLVFGFTATGTNGEYRDVNQLFENVIDDYDVKACIEQGILSPVRVWLVETGQQLDIGSIKRFNDIPAEKLRELGERTQRGLLSAKIASDFIASGKKGLIRCPAGQSCAFAVERAQQLNNMMYVDQDGTTRRIRAAAVGSSIKGSEEIIKAYKRGELDVLCYVKMISRGFDDPQTEFFIDESPTLSPVEGTQGPGRALRKHEGKIAHIVHLLDDITSDGKPINAFTMLHALGVEEYEAGIHFGPTDKWRGSDPSYELKEYDILNLFSHEIRAIIKRTEVNIARRYDEKQRGELCGDIKFVSVTQLMQKSGLPQSFISKMLQDNNVRPVRSGKRKLYDERMSTILLELRAIHHQAVDPIEHGWVPTTYIHEDMIEEFMKHEHALTPLKHVNSKGKYARTTGSYFSPTQWKIIHDTYLNGAEESDERTKIFQIYGHSSLTKGAQPSYNSAQELQVLFRKSLPPMGNPVEGGYSTEKHDLYQSEIRRCENLAFEFSERAQSLVYEIVSEGSVFQAARSTRAALQHGFEELQDRNGTRDRISYITTGSADNKGKVFGRFVDKQEFDQLLEGLGQIVPIEKHEDIYSRNKDISINDLTDDHTISLEKAVLFVNNLIHSQSLLQCINGQFNPDQLVRSMWQALGELELSAKLVVLDDRYDNRRIELWESVPIKKLLQGLQKAAQEQGINVQDSISFIVKNFGVSTLDNKTIRGRYEGAGGDKLLRH